MTNYIKEMMKTAGVTSDFIPRYINGGVATYWYLNEYPEFTAEKQLELIKLILCSDDIDELRQYYSEILKAFFFECYSLPECGMQSSWISENKDYSLALAELVTMLMNAGELDKSKVKEILNK